MQPGSKRLHPSCYEGLGAGVKFEERQGCGPTRISKHLAELGKQHLQQGVDLIAVACDVLG
jgi:hypothetical protein